ncbi:6-carboxytetrahydropterin synthase [Streptomyces sp. NPDC048191]|uniref:6-pyruvoyl trahydropterin synthase family protein n=1 Tax=Streptomyces sp. NPDC048191 TaxID=3155484 RepID=UPI0033C3F5F6
MKTLEFAYAHRLLRYSGKCQYLHGHNGRLEVVLRSDHLDEVGFVADFGLIKETIGEWVQNNLDHRVLLCRKDPLIPMLQESGQPVFVMDDNPTAENIAKSIWDSLTDCGLPISEIRLWETSTSIATYCGDQ